MNTDKPEYNKVYALTGATGEKCIANGNTWKESEVPKEKNVRVAFKDLGITSTPWRKSK